MHDPCARWRELLFCESLLGSSAALAGALEEAWNAAGCGLPVLVLGETGTGKNLLARAIHDASGRADRPFVTVACNTVPDTLFDAQLFGALRGAFTGALQPMAGLVERAEGGTLFFDEIGELPALAQTKLLGLIQSGRWAPLGSTRERSADVRVIAATNAPLSALREDVLHRLGGFQIRMPSLAERVEDLPVLAEGIAAAFARKERQRALPLEALAVQVLLARRWPGNVRELENVVRRGLVKAWREGAAAVTARHLSDVPLPPYSHPPIRDQLRAYQSWLVDQAMAETGRNVAEAAARLGVSSSWIYKHLAERLHRAPV